MSDGRGRFQYLPKIPKYTANASMDSERSPSKMETNIRESSTTDYCMEGASSSGPTVSNMKASLLTIESPVQAFIDGLIPASMKDKLKTDCAMESESTPFNKLLMRANGLKAKNRAKEKSSLKAEVYSRALSKMISSKAMAKCTIILPETILKDNGKMTRKKERAP